MKAVILAAGLPGRDFPEDSKPKCLHHVRGRTLLEIVVAAALEAGIADIRLVVGYKADAIREYAARKPWALEYAFNEDWLDDSVKSIEVGLKDLRDDALLLSADLVIDAELIRQFMRTDPRRPAWIRSMISWDPHPGDRVYDDLYRSDIDNNIVKIPESLLGMFEGARARADRFLDRYHWHRGTAPGTGLYFGAAITETFYDYRPIEEVVIPAPVQEFDFYSGTDEYKLGRLFHGRFVTSAS